MKNKVNDMRKKQLNFIKKKIKPLSKKLEKVYRFLNLTWEGSKNTPTAKEIEKVFFSLMMMMKDENIESVEREGLFISIEKEYEGEDEEEYDKKDVYENVEIGMKISEEKKFII